jgi:hypothetical protein
MTKFFSTIQHHSIASAREIEIDGTMTDAKRKAAREFSGEQNDFRIVIFAAPAGIEPYKVSSRRVGGRKWEDRY